MVINEMIGVECGKCHEEAFQLVPRIITHEVKVCPKCSHLVDLEAEEQAMKEASKFMSKAERRRNSQQASFNWAAGLNGKQVVVYYGVSDGRGTIIANCKIRGVISQAPRVGGGYGQVRVIIDEWELYRVLYIEDYYWRNHQKFYYQRPILDSFFWGLFITDGWNGKEDKPLCFYVSWGCRHEMVIEVLE